MHMLLIQVSKETIIICEYGIRSHDNMYVIAYVKTILNGFRYKLGMMYRVLVAHDRVGYTYGSWNVKQCGTEAEYKMQKTVSIRDCS